MKQRAFALLKSWCDRLISLQITELADKNLYGGLMCPACKTIHGRCCDAVLPFMYLYSETKDEKYFTAAKRVVDWAENNVKCNDGSYRNDIANGWKCTSSFFQISLGEALQLFSGITDKDTYQKWYSIFVRITDFMATDFVVNAKPHVNYFCAWAHSLALAYEITGNKEYARHARLRFDYSMSLVGDDGFLYGEGKPHDAVTKKGVRFIDIGYNFEESLPSLAACARILGDKEALSKVEKAILTHIEFVLPDGALDNSFGTRNCKWTYYGSRTSDGCQTELLKLDNPIIREAALRNFEQYEKCSRDGYLYGGPMYGKSGENGCIHHSFCHAKSLVGICLSENCENPNAVLPRDKEYGVKTFQSAGVTLVSKGKWRASVAHGDAYVYKDANPFGGALSLLYHTDLGVVCAASMTKYWIVEPLNMQLPRDGSKCVCSTVRLEKGDFSNLYDTQAQLSENLTVTGNLCDVNQNADAGYSIAYSFDNDFTMTVRCDCDAKLVLPVVGLEKLNIDASGEYKAGKEFLSLVNGFVFSPLEFDVFAGKELKITISAK